ncbi:hypothetical protein CWI36_0531p0040 [Hamiltosporidium magnivora]|uniref:Ribosomal protein P2 n=1 Tax=Hamiltosporidium magnivora TaxID=148818 RepID=A0A4Q9LGF3_9MICR|nr:hypothetical protein CWI36_0531p0040 [Hamiltosporidium magnivora]
MEYIAAYAILSVAGKPVTEDSISKLFTVVPGKECDKEQVQLLINNIKGRDYNSIKEEGSKKMSSFSSVSVQPSAVKVADESGNKEEAEAPKEEEMDLDLFADF